VSSVSPRSGQVYRFIYHLKPGAGPEYDARHREVWPALLTRFDEVGIYDYRIWRHANTVVCSLRASGGYEKTAKLLASDPVQKQWTSSLKHLFEQIDEPDGAPLWLTEVFAFKCDANETPGHD